MRLVDDPLPLAVVTTGAARASASARHPADADRAPPPRTTAGRRAERRTRAASRSEGPAGPGADSGGVSRTGPAGCAVSSRSSGTSIWTGRGRRVRNRVNARATAEPISSTVDTRWLNAATARSASVWLRISCSRPVGCRGWRNGIPGDTTSSGTLSEYA